MRRNASMKYRKTDIVKICALALCLLTDIFYIFFSLCILLYDREPSVPLLGMAIMTVHSVVITGITVCGLFKIKQGHRSVLIPNFLLKLLTVWIELGFLWLVLEIYTAAVLALISGFLILGIYITVKCVKRKKKLSIVSDLEPTKMFRSFFTADSAKRAWDDAAKEYCRLNGRSLEELTEAERDKINEYACTPAAYFLAWLIKKDYVSEGFKQRYDDKLLDEIKNETANPVDFLCHEMNCTFNSNDISEELLSFIDVYYDFADSALFYSHLTRQYPFDYYKVIRNDDRTYYCTDFSWEVYHILESKIDDNYREHSGAADVYERRADSFDLHTKNSEALWHRFGSIDVIAVEDVSDEYIKSCIDQLNSLDDSFYDKLCDVFIDRYPDYLEVEGMEDAAADKRKILEHIYPSTLIINMPKKNEPAFVVAGECDFEQEHGLAWAMRNDTILEVGYYADVESPWCRENELTYAIAESVKEIDPYNIDSDKEAEMMLKTGALKPIYSVHECFGGEPSEDNKVFVPPVIADLKDEYDIMTELLFIRGMVNKYSCIPQYKGNSVIPSEVLIQASNDQKIIFSEKQGIW